MKIDSNQGYEEDSENLIDRYERLSFDQAHQHVIDLIPGFPANILDIGAGTGRDAAYLAEQGHHVVAIEPTDAFHKAAKALHPPDNIEWIEDSLPNLSKIITRAGQFDLIMMTAVWMHLDRVERERGMPIVASLLKTAALLIMTLRHGPVPEGRRMFEISTEEMLALATKHSLKPVRLLDSESVQQKNRENGVTWSNFVFRKSASD